MESIKNQVTIQLATALQDCFKNEENRSFGCEPIDLDKIKGNDLILAMYSAFRLTISSLCNYDIGDPIDFLSTIAHLLLQEALENQLEKLNGTDDIEDDE